MHGFNTISYGANALAGGLAAFAAAIIIQAAIDGYIKRELVQNGQPIKGEHKYKAGPFKIEDKWEPAAT